MVASEVPAVETMVTGVVTLPEGAVVPEGALWTVQLQDTSRADAEAVVIDEADGVVDPASTDIPFEIAYDAATILDTNTYTLQARLEDASGTLLYVNDTAIPVLTGGAPSEGLIVPVIAVEPAASVAAEASVAPGSVSSPEASPAT
jgi:putative lipoprotein